MWTLTCAVSHAISHLVGSRDHQTDSSSNFKDFRPPFNNEPDDYRKLREDQEKKRNELLSHPNRFQRISQREDRSDWPAETTRLQAKGKYFARYRGFDICKSPEDFVLYHQLFSIAQPATVIELGTLSGGMSVWIADTLNLLNLSCQIYSMDLDSSLLSDTVKELKPENVTFLQGDCFAIENTFTPELLSTLPHPWVFIDDAHANMRGVLEYFHKFFKEGDYAVVEDTNPNLATVAGMGGVYEEFEVMGPKSLNCLKSFLRDFEDYYAVDTFITDLYGYNGCWHWHGFIRRMK